MTRNETERRVDTEPPPHVHSREDEAADAYGLGWLCFTTVMGLASYMAALFSALLSLSGGLQYFGLAVCVGTFLLSAIGLARFFERPMKGDLHHGDRS